MSEQGGFGAPTPSGGMTENLDGLLHPPTGGGAPGPAQAALLGDPTQHIRRDRAPAPPTRAAVPHVLQANRVPLYDALRLSNVPAPGLDAVSINAAKEIGQWAASQEPGSLRWALESGAVQLEKAAKALEQSLATHCNTDEVNAAQLRRTEL